MPPPDGDPWNPHGDKPFCLNRREHDLGRQLPAVSSCSRSDGPPPAAPIMHIMLSTAFCYSPTAPSSSPTMMRRRAPFGRILIGDSVNNCGKTQAFPDSFGVQLTRRYRKRQVEGLVIGKIQAIPVDPQEYGSGEQGKPFVAVHEGVIAG